VRADRPGRRTLGHRLKQVAAPIRTELVDLLRTGCGYDDRGVQALGRELVQADRAACNVQGGYWIASDNSEVTNTPSPEPDHRGRSRGSARMALLSDDEFL
jgi:hypothetical protein